MIRLFEIENHTVKATEHCYMISWLKNIMDKYPDTYLKMYAYIFYMTCPSQENPYYNVAFDVREACIRNDIALDFDVEDDLILIAIEKSNFHYETPTVRAHKGIAKMLDNVIYYMETSTITGGKDGNLPALIRLAEKFDSIRVSYKNVAKDLEEEQRDLVRGKQNLAYDQQ